MGHASLQQKEIRGLNTAWLQTGSLSGEHLFFFIHGCPDTPEVWKNQLRHFSKLGLCVAPFLRGIGTSAATKDSNRYGLNAVALDHLSILREVDPDSKKKVVVIGHDIGSIHACRLAHLLGSRAAALVLINGMSVAQFARRLVHFRQLKKSWYIFMFQVPWVSDQLVSRYGNRLLDLAHRAGHCSAVQKDVRLQPFLEYYRQALRDAPQELFDANSDALSAPVLVLWGDQDAFLEVPTESEFKSFKQNVTLRILDGNHWLQLEKAEKLNRLIEEFLR